MSGKRIENDEQYQTSLTWLVSKALKLEDPLVDGPEREKLQQQYDFVFTEAQRYRRGEMIKEYPGLREVYAKLGWEFDDPGEQLVHEQPTPDPLPESDSKAAPEQPESEPQAVKLSDWLDDD